jgi:hypothetical protein
VTVSEFPGFGSWRAPAVLLSLAAIALGVATPASAARHLDVCQAGCAYSNIQAAVDATDTGGAITIAAGTYDGSVTISKDVTLIGAGADLTTITQSARSVDTIFTPGSGSVITITSDASVTIRDITVSGGFEFVCTPTGGIPSCSGDGGGINNSGTLTLRQSAVSGNTAGRGGGIYNTGTIDLSQSVVSGNQAVSGGGQGTRGGGIFNAGTMLLNKSTVNGNSASFGGGISNDLTGTMVLRDSTVDGNVSSPTLFLTGGAGIENAGTLTLNHSTVSNNTSDAFGTGGGIYCSGTVTLNHSTVSGNTAGEGGGMYNVGTAALSGSAVTGNTADVDGGGILNSGGTVALNHSSVSGNDPNDLVGV